MPRISLLCVTAIMLCGLAASASAQVDIRHRWVYVSPNLLVEKDVDSLVAAMERASKAGYNGIMLSDYRFSLLDRQDQHYFANLRRVLDAAAKLKLDLIPSIFSIGYSGGLLSHDQNLAAGLPVRDAPFVVRGGKIVPDDPIAMVNADFEQLGTGRKVSQFAG